MEGSLIRISERAKGGKIIRPQIERAVEHGELVLLTRLPRTVHIGKPQHTAPPVLGVFEGANSGIGIEKLYFAADYMFEIGERKIGGQRVPILSPYRSCPPIDGNPSTREISGAVVSRIYVGREEVASQLRTMDLVSVADLIERLQPHYI